MMEPTVSLLEGAMAAATRIAAQRFGLQQIDRDRNSWAKRIEVRLTGGDALRVATEVIFEFDSRDPKARHNIVVPLVFYGASWHYVQGDKMDEILPAAGEVGFGA